MRRPYSLRTWILVGIVGLVLIPYVGTGVLAFLSESFEPPPPQEPAPRDAAAVEALYRKVESASDRWHDQGFQAEVLGELKGLALGIRIFGPDEELVLDTVSEGSLVEISPRQWLLTSARVLRTTVVYDGPHLVGTVTWFDHNPYIFPERQRFAWLQSVVVGWIGIPVLIIGTIALAVRLASRAVLSPLRALSVAAGKINRRELDFAVPASPVREVTEFATAFDQMRAGLKESIARQAEMEQERRMFIAAMAHDLRTPLTSVRGYLEGLRDGVAHTPEKRERYVGVALEKAQRMERLIEGLFAFAKTEYLEQPPQMEPLMLGELLEGAAAGLRPQAEAKGVVFRLDEGPEPCRFEGDPLMLARVVDNLLDNAIRHTPAGGEVVLGWRGGVDHCRFWVQDSGPGIPANELGQVFQPLYRGDQSRGSRTGGAGLGLAIAQRLVEAHSGEMSVESGPGTTFTVVLPIR